MSAPEGDIASLLREVQWVSASLEAVTELRKERASIEQFIDQTLSRLQHRALSRDEEVYVMRTVERLQERLEGINQDIRRALDLNALLRVS